MIIVTDENFGRHLYLPVKSTNLSTKYGFNCVPFNVMANNVRMSPASNKTAGTLLGSFHKSYLTSNKTEISDLQPIGSVGATIDHIYGGEQWHGVDTYRDIYSNSYGVATSQSGSIIKYNTQSITTGEMYITDTNYSSGTHQGTSYYAKFQNQDCYAIRCPVFYDLTINNISSYYVLLVKGTKSEILNDGFSFTQIVLYGNFSANYDPQAGTLTTSVSAQYYQSEAYPETLRDVHRGIFCDVRPLYTKKIYGEDYCVISVTRLFYGDFMPQGTVQWVAMPYICHNFGTAYIIHAGMEMYGTVQLHS